MAKKPGLPKKYAKMGFKKGWAEYKKTMKATAKKRKASLKKKPASSSKPSTGSSNPSGGRKMDGIGSMLRKVKLVQDIAAPAEGASIATGDWEAKGKNALRRYAAYDIDSGTMNVDWVKPTAQGVGMSLAEDYIDGKTGHAAGLSRGAIADWVEELIPAFRAHLDASGTFHSTTNHLLYWTKYRTGYDGSDHTFDVGRAREFLTAKIVRIGLRKSGIASKINRRLPKKVNI